MRRFACLEAVPQLLDASPDPSRHAALKGLDPPELAAFDPAGAPSELSCFRCLIRIMSPY
jgi:hypothetical protein